MYFEDVDLAQRLGRAGWATTWVPAAEITHSGAHSTGNSTYMRHVHHESARRYLDRKYSAAWLAPLRWVLRIGLLVRERVTR
jgi:N-acetylglucosaminyl-diphospho-decaprenol L-rhamnosyltransferase